MTSKSFHLSNTFSQLAPIIHELYSLKKKCVSYESVIYLSTYFIKLET